MKQLTLLFLLPLFFLLGFFSSATAQVSHAGNEECQNLLLSGVSTIPSSVVSQGNPNDFGRDRVMLGDIDGNGVNDMLVYSKTYSGGNGFALLHVLFLDADGNVTRYKTNQENVFQFPFYTYYMKEYHQ
jgi:hypothetical protein